ncbi:MAG TPA: copper resistance protein CopC [Gaiellaceae bacterium]|nr:copper resistance protein CopC [Gaiellaceae bacterium]
MRLGIALGTMVAALLVPAAAFAHATLLQTTPANGAVLSKAPTSVTVVFDDGVRVAKGNAAVDNATQASVLAGKASVRGRELTIPLKPLRDGAYSVRWSIVSDDGHREEGVLAFAVGEGSAPPHPVLGASVPLTWNDILLRTLYYLGVLAGGGVAAFGLLARRIVGPALGRPIIHLLFFSLLLVFLGGSGILHSAPAGTRFALVTKIALTVSLAGGAAAALAPTISQLRPVAYAAAFALLAAPTLSGHALDRDQPRILAAVVDLAHLASAAVWLGGLIAVVYALPRATEDDPTRRAAVATFSTAALASVALLGATGIVRALTELSAVSQLWSTSYGRALLVKTGIFVPLLGIGWLNRAVLMRVFARLRRSARVEVVAIVGIVIAVAILTELAPGKKAARSLASAPLSAAAPPALPPREAVVDARELGSLAVAVAREPHRTTVTIIGPDATGVDDRDVRVNGATATRCGPGCYRAPTPATGRLHVSIGDRTLTFDIEATAPDATALLARITRTYRASRTIVFDETLASSPANAQTTRFTAVAPHRLSYQTRGGGPAAIVIGARRWDRSVDNAPWQPSAQTPIDVTEPYWTEPTNAHLVSPDTITFLDRKIPAWFRVTFRGSRPAVQHMTAAAHFMTDRYVGFDVAAEVSPPSR